MCRITNNDFLNYGTTRVCIDLTEVMWQYYDALYSKWEENDYGHSFEDFGIEVFDMKIAKGKVAINIELGS